MRVGGECGSSWQLPCGPYVSQPGGQIADHPNHTAIRTCVPEAHYFPLHKVFWTVYRCCHFRLYRRLIYQAVVVVVVAAITFIARIEKSLLLRRNSCGRPPPVLDESSAAGCPQPSAAPPAGKHKPWLTEWDNRSFLWSCFSGTVQCGRHCRVRESWSYGR